MYFLIRVISWDFEYDLLSSSIKFTNSIVSYYVLHEAAAHKYGPLVCLESSRVTRQIVVTSVSRKTL